MPNFILSLSKSPNSQFPMPHAHVYQYFDGIRDYMAAINRDRQPLHGMGNGEWGMGRVLSFKF